MNLGMKRNLTARATRIFPSTVGSAILREKILGSDILFKSWYYMEFASCRSRTVLYLPLLNTQCNCDG
ncbi:hypothetical protein I79_025959 [Cricetulus griseus]|uniref:Uncharacterized protein n=1 Tax=Cricetulus griseus TaxID=10029 RepID=G3IPP0_CRIGR|nr:hypothetical protein I79_025959 [Cricetulus griseus]